MNPIDPAGAAPEPGDPKYAEFVAECRRQALAANSSADSDQIMRELEPLQVMDALDGEGLQRV